MTTSEPGYRAPDTSLLGAEHIQRYRETSGEVGYLWNGAPTLLLTTIGRRSGQPRTSALIFGTDRDDYLIVASQGGAPSHPNWYLNLIDNPEVELQIKDVTLTAIARTASEEDKPRLWKIVTTVWPNYDVYQTRTERPIPVVVLSPNG